MVLLQGIDHKVHAFGSLRREFLIFHVLEGNNLRKILPIPRQTSALRDAFYVELWLIKGYYENHFSKRHRI